jgi:hypothetical protein
MKPLLIGIGICFCIIIFMNLLTTKDEFVSKLAKECCVYKMLQARGIK